MRQKHGRRIALGTVVAIAAMLIAATAAQASVISIGSVLPKEFTSKKFERVQTFFNTALPETGANLTSPVTGAIVRWRVQGAKGGPFYLRVLHPNGKGAYEAAGTSLPAIPASEGLQTFSTNLPIQAGDLIGIDPTNASDEIGFSTAAGASYAAIFPTPFDGSIVAPSETFSGEEIELSAEVQPAPEVTLVSPPAGPITGGALVTITGKNLSNASAVEFGSTPAASFTVDSDTEITATAPRGARPGKVDVTVKTIAGKNANTRFDDYVYQACVVPAIKGKSLSKAKQLLKRHSCQLGHVKKVDVPNKKAGKVLKQAPKAGMILAPGSRVRINLGK
ncbi:MAG TPA: IPT/TIG domain-containing protein [Solirubrobacterales bacterium]|nr:IPT/TIG domain-containing protein [Solirubrobacterales bacterium]